jgi:hypothetical protein
MKCYHYELFIICNYYRVNKLEYLVISNTIYIIINQYLVFSIYFDSFYLLLIIKLSQTFIEKFEFNNNKTNCYLKGYTYSLKLSKIFCKI